MGLWGWLSGTSQPEYDESAIAGAGVIASWQATKRGTLKAPGGRLVLTDRALIFSPLDMEGTKQAIDLVLSIAQLPAETVLSQLAAGSQQAPLSIALNNIASVEQTGHARAMSPPTVKLVTRVGSVHHFGVMAGFLFPNASKENDAATADFLQKIASYVPAPA